MKALISRIGEALLILGAVPIEKRNANWRISVGMVKEAQGYLHIKNNKQAELMLKASVPYMARLND